MTTLEEDPLVCDVVKQSLIEQSEIETAESDEAVVDNYHKFIVRKWVLIFGCIIASFVIAGYSLSVGDVQIEFWDCYQILWDHITGNVTDTMLDFVIVGHRLPRIVTGIIAGAGLAVAGVAMQSILKNPLADPYTTGVSSGAAFGATIAITTGFSVVAGRYGLILNAFIMSLIPVAMILVVSRLKNSSPTVMIMAGIAVMYVFNACSTILKLWSDPEKLSELVNWSVGSLSMTEWPDIYVMLVFTLIGGILLQILSRKLNVLATGDESAKSLGVDADKLRKVCMVVVALIAAAIVSFTGLIGFVGLVAPHVVRLIIGPDNRYLLPASALFGAALLIASDLVGRTIIAPVVLQVGVITAFLGGPLFLWLIVRKKSEIWG